MNVSKPMELRLTDGFALFAVLRFTEQKHEGRKIFYDLSSSKSSTKLSVGLDAGNGLTMWVIDSRGLQFNTAPIPPESFMGRFVILQFEVRALDVSSAVIRVGTTPGMFREQLINATFMPLEPCRVTIGANAAGSENAAFEVAEILAYSDVPARSDQEKIRHYFAEQYKLSMEGAPNE